MPLYRSEEDVKREVKKILNTHGWMYWMPPGSAFGKVNVDFNALRRGVFLAIETKYRENRPTPLQKKFLISVRMESGLGFWFNEVGIGCFRLFMEAFDRLENGKERDEDETIILNTKIQLMKGLIQVGK